MHVMVMQSAELPKNEKARVNKLKATGVLNADRHKQFTVFNEVAKIITNCSASFVNIIDQDTQYALSSSGVDKSFLEPFPRKTSICQYALLDPEPTIIPDLTKDSRFSSLSIVADYPNIKFYAGFPLITNEGLILGTLCVMDFQPSELREEQIRLMKNLTINVCHQIMNLEAQKSLIVEKTKKILSLVNEIAPQCNIANIQHFLQFADSGVMDSNAGEDLARLGLVERFSGETENGYQITKTAHKIAAELGEFEKPYSGTILSQGDSRINVDELLKQIDEDF